jgi:chromosome partitioning protein
VRVFAVANQKGGVGKTTTVINLGAYLGELGHRVLLVDCDPQSNTTRSITASSPTGPNLYDVLVDEATISSAIVATSTPGVDLLPASPDLAGSEVELMNVSTRERTLKKKLSDLRNKYHYLLLDCPPSLGLLTINALVAAQSVIVPVQCEYLALEGVSRLLDTINRIRSNLNPNLRIFGLVMTMYDRRTSLSGEVAREVRRHYPELTFQTVIPRNVRLSEAPSFGVPISEYDPHSLGAQAYSSLALEVANRV